MLETLQLCRRSKKPPNQGVLPSVTTTAYHYFSAPVHGLTNEDRAYTMYIMNKVRIAKEMRMSKIAVVSKWGNAQGIRLPKAFCSQLGISAGDKVSLSIEGGKLIMTNADEKYTFDALAKDWDGERQQAKEIDWGKPAGNEMW
jgi:antitoxin MazE